MRFNKHTKLEGLHAFLGASKYSWVNYDDEKLIESWNKQKAQQLGTELHDFAARAIKLGIKLQETNQTLNLYINDAIGFGMEPEVILKPDFIHYCFGTADAISFKKNKLRIHDLKTGVTPAKFTQLQIYAALYCMEYDVHPNDIEIELRIYQNDECYVEIPESDDILYIMAKIKRFDNIIKEMQGGY